MVKTDRRFKLLKRHAEKIGVSVRFASPGEIPGYQGVFKMIGREIVLSKHLTRRPFSLIYTMAHELGHAVDLLSMDRKQWQLSAMASGAFNFWKDGLLFISKRRLRRLRTIVIQAEQRAYDRGHEVLRELGVLLPEEKMRKDREMCLESYRQIFDDYLDS